METGKAIILRLLLYGHEIWFLKSPEEHRLLLVRGIFGHKMKEKIKEWRKIT
jgi:hypothetical protein